jgi:hypothetical protein
MTYAPALMPLVRAIHLNLLHSDRAQCFYDAKHRGYSSACFLVKLEGCDVLWVDLRKYLWWVRMNPKCTPVPERRKRILEAICQLEEEEAELSR